MTGLIKRNLLVFFRDRAAVFFSFLVVLIIIGMYALFLGDAMLSGYEDVSGARAMFDSWTMAGVLAVASVTTTMGAFSIMVEDKTKKITKDIYSAPVKRRAVTGAYILSSYTVGVIMSLTAFVFAELYIVLGGGSLLGAAALLKILGLILISCFANTSMVLFAVSFFKSANAFSAASAILSTLIGFLTGIYLPIGNLPEGVQFFIKIFPVSHAAVLFRQVMMDESVKTVFNGAPQETVTQFNETMGVAFRFGDTTLKPLASILVLVLTAVVFTGLSAFNMSRKQK